MSDSFSQNFRVFCVINFSFIVMNIKKYDRGLQAETNFLPLEQHVWLRQFS
jgi:hypothetical protein